MSTTELELAAGPRAPRGGPPARRAGTRTAGSRTAGSRAAAAGASAAGPVLAGRPAAAAADLLARSRAGLAAAWAAPTPEERYVAAHLAGLRAGAAVLAVRGRPRRGVGLGVWQVLPRVAPELEDAALRLAAGARRRAAVEAGRTGVVTAQDAEEHLREAEAFAGAVAAVLGLPVALPLPLPAAGAVPVGAGR